jgi:predicted aspartyl protease
LNRLTAFEAVLLFSWVTAGSLVLRSAAQAQSETPSNRSQIYATPEDNAQPIGELAGGEITTPIGETQVGGGAKWFLVKTKSGLIGWIKQDHDEHSKKADNFFKSRPADPAVVSVTIPNVSSSSAPRGAILVPVLSNGRSMIVNATMNQIMSGNFLVDTGATNTVISRRLANLLRLQPANRGVVHTVGGPVSVGIAHLDSLKVGSAEVTNLPILVHDFSPDPRVEGLLGMDFLSRFQVGFDSQKNLIILSPR